MNTPISGSRACVSPSRWSCPSPATTKSTSCWPSSFRSVERPGPKRISRCSSRSQPLAASKAIRTLAVSPSSRDDSRSFSSTTKLVTAAMVGIVSGLGGLVEEAQLDHLDGVANCHATRLGDLAVYPERYVPVARLVFGERAVTRDRPQGVEVGLTCLRVLSRDCAAPDVTADSHQCLADPQVPLHPPVLLVRVAPVELEEHPEAAT